MKSNYEMFRSERDGLEHYFLLLASLEHNNHIMKKHQRLLNVMTDICQDVSNESFLYKSWRPKGFFNLKSSWMS